MFIYFLLLLACSSVICEDCLTVNFENGFEEKFTHTGVCSSRSMWDIKQYSSLNVGSPHPRSTRFVTPQSAISCMSSFNFTMSGGGILEFNRFMSSNLAADYVIIEIYRFNVGAPVSMVATRAFGPMYTDNAQGWQTLRIPIPGSGRLDGYILFWGRVSTTTTILIDSFRYIGPSFDRDLCVIYKEEEKQTTTTEIVPTTKEPTTVPPVVTTIKDTTTTEVPTSTTSTEIPTTTTSTEIPRTVYSTSTATPTTTEESTTIKSPPTTEDAIPSARPTTTEEINETTTMMPTNTSVITTTPATPTRRPRLFISILLIKIKKFFR